MEKVFGLNDPNIPDPASPPGPRQSDAFKNTRQTASHRRPLTKHLEGILPIFSSHCELRGG